MAAIDFTDRITGDGPLGPVIFRLAAPVVAMMYLQNAYNIIDTIWVGQLLGKVALAGIGAGGYVLWTLFGLTGLVSTGLTAVIARRFGQRNVEDAQIVAARGLWYSLVLSVVIGIMLWFLLPSIFRMMGTGADVTAQGISYMKVLVLATPLIFLSFSIQSIYQASGDTVTPMWLVAISLMINTILDPVLMLGLFGCPRMGIAGAALATVISRAAWVLLGMYLLFKGKRIGQRQIHFSFLGKLSRALPTIRTGPLKLNLDFRCGWNWRLFGTILRLGLPHAFSMTLFPLVYMVIVRIPAQFGAHQIAALKVGHTVEGMSFFLALGFMIATSTCVGQNLGANKPQRAKKAAWTATGIVAVILFLFSICFWFLARPISAVFSPDPATIQAGAAYLRILAFSQVFMGLEIVLGGGFTGAGDTFPPMLVAVPFNLLRIPAAYFLSGTLGMGVIGVWWAISGSSIAKGIALSFLFVRGRWMLKKV